MEIPYSYLSVKNKLGEGIFYDQLKKQIYWVDILESKIYVHYIEQNKVIHWDTSKLFSNPSFIAPTVYPDKFLVAASQKLYLWNMENNTLPLPPNAKPIAYFVRHWDYGDNKWATLPDRFTSKRDALAFAKATRETCKASVLAHLSNGKKVFIAGTKR